jgi:hypothetical protein
MSTAASSPTLDEILTAALELEADNVAHNRPLNPPIERLLTSLKLLLILARLINEFG